MEVIALRLLSHPRKLFKLILRIMLFVLVTSVRYYPGEPLLLWLHSRENVRLLTPNNPYLGDIPPPPLGPLPDLHLQSGPPIPGEGGGQGERGVHIEASGQHGMIHLNSDSLGWMSSSSSASASASASATTATATATAPKQGTGPVPNPSGFTNHSGSLNTSYSPHRFVPSFRVDGNRFEAGGFSDAVRLSAARSFDLAVIRADDGVEKTGDTNVGKEDERRRMRQEREQSSRSSSWSRSEAAQLRGDSESMNASAGLVSVEVMKSKSTRRNLQRLKKRNK